MENFRKEAVNHVINVCMAAVKAMGYDSPGKHSATGTPGWKSDIDTVYQPPPGMPEETQNMEKLIFDMVFIHEFKGSSGQLFDTESYIQHAGIAFDTEKGLETPEGKAGFGRLELNAASLQMMRQCGGPDKKPDKDDPTNKNAWDKFKETQLEAAKGNKALQVSLSESFQDVEGMERDFQDGINIELIKHSGKQVPATRKERTTLAAEILAENPVEAPQLKQNATMAFKTKALMRLGKEMDACKKNIDSLDQRIAKSSQSSMLRGVLNAVRGTSLPSMNKQKEEAILRLGTLALIRESFFDEGYVTQGSFLKVCFLAEGQMHLRQVEAVHQRIRSSSNEELHSQIAGVPVERRASNSQQNAATLLENMAMYKGHFEKNLTGKTDEDYQTAAIETSKYSERALGAALELLKAIEQANPNIADPEMPEYNKDYVALKNQLQDAYEKASSFEKVKRGSVLSVAATSDFLWMFLSADKSPEELVQLKNDIKTILERPEFKFEESLLPEDRYLAMITSLEGYIDFDTEEKTRTFIDENGNSKKETYSQIKLDEHGRVKTNHHDVELILKARCGLDQDDVEVQTYHEHARTATLIKYDLMKKDKITDNNSEIEKLTTRAYKMSVDQQIDSMSYSH